MKPRPALLLAGLMALSLAADGPRLTLEQLFQPAQRLAFLAQPTSRYAWTPDGALLETRTEKKGVSLWRLDPRTGDASPLLDSGRVIASLVAAGAAEAPVHSALAAGALIWREDRTAFLIAVDGALYCVEPSQARARRVTGAGADEATFSPDGARVAFLRGNDLYAVELATGRETRLTMGGDENRLNGRLDWVYQEEIYGRGSFKGFWWAPDSKRIAYLCLDESRVPTYVLMDDRTQPQRRVATRYPKAGEPNPVASLGVVDLEGRTTWMKDAHPGAETLLVRVGWDPAGRLLACVQDRVQTWLELLRFEGDAGHVLIHEASRAWQQDLPLPRFLKDGGFLWESDRTGFRHVYRYDANAHLLGALTTGEWDVKKVHGVDEKAGHIYFDATERSPIGQDLYRADLGGKAPNAGLARLTEAPGTHGVTFDPTFHFFLDRWSDARTPARQAVFEASGRQVRMLDAAATPLFTALRKGQIRFQQVKTRDGFPMETLLVLPPDFDPAKKYPLLQEVYGGPGAPLVRDAFGRSALWYQFLAQQGIVTWICDNRSASAKGVASGFGVHHHLGAQELQDQLDGLAWLKAQGWADMDRIALYGYSYGGFFTSYALTHAKAWKLGVIGAPVTDWRFYDSIYTERYMGLPKDNPEGYEAASVLGRAAELTAKVMFIHGTLDDNVHPQNTVQFMDALQKAGHTAPLVLMPGSGHSPRAPQHEWAMHEGIWEFLKQNL